jgi:hypothetical protein
MPKVRTVLTISFEADNREAAVELANRIAAGAPEDALHVCEVMRDPEPKDLSRAAEFAGLALRRAVFPQTEIHPAAHPQ